MIEEKLARRIRKKKFDKSKKMIIIGYNLKGLLFFKSELGGKYYVRKILFGFRTTNI